jgi:hypothetical protein
LIDSLVLPEWEKINTQSSLVNFVTKLNCMWLTGNSGSELAGLSDEAIIVVTEEGLFRAESLASRISYFCLNGKK